MPNAWLFFFPWMTLKQPVQVGDVVLHPYEKGKLPGALGCLTQAHFDGVLSRYGDREYGISRDSAAHVKSAVIAWWNSDGSAMNLCRGTIEQRLQWSQIVAFSAVACRRFRLGSYCNSDQVRFVAQPFELSHPRRIATRSRTRHGSSLNMIGSTAGLPVYMRPLHVDQRWVAQLDAALIDAIMNSRNVDIYCSAIELFNAANSDSSDVALISEVVLLRAAFETVLRASHRTKQLRRRLSEHFSDVPSQWPLGKISEAMWRDRWPSDVERPIDAWVQDFCAVRNRAAHGSVGESRETIWGLSQHLLFGSWLFPLIVKKQLNDEGLFQMTPLDHLMRLSAERFLGEDVLATEDDGDSIEWEKIESDIRLTILARQMYPEQA